MDVTEKMIKAAGRAIYDRHLAEGMIDIDPNEATAKELRFWRSEFEADARVALEAARDFENADRQRIHCPD